ncbi:unnamed protein product [Rotaria sordida]|uniref:F-box domain-containing protein n=1 Tax=Rotaria sordida TaxID=392033 RepID=A0A819B2Y8_9BILA|nr:unnamed protein product [Rotaria sordida]
MEDSSIELNELPDEILIIILKKLFNTEVLYSLIDVNKRLNTIVHDPIFTSHLTLMRCFSDDSIYPLPDSILDRFCSQILSSIHHKIKWLNLESSSMKRILLATNYPNLYGLGLYNIEAETALSLFIDESCLTSINKNKISSLVIDVTKYKKISSSKDVIVCILTHIFNVFCNLQYLNFCPSSISYQRLLFDKPFPTMSSSTLLELHISLANFTDCLYILDGRFNKLHTLYVDIDFISSLHLTNNNQEKLPNLRCFSLFCEMPINVYNKLIVSFLQRIISLRNQIYLQSKEDIQHTFRDFKDDQVISYVDYFQKEQCSLCHIYLYLDQLKYYYTVTNNFPGGLFPCVRKISLYDDHPFEHEFFLRIAQSFPFMQTLSLKNFKPQNNKLCKESQNDNQNFSIINYPYLTNLTLYDAHDDYIEEFLVDTKICLPNNAVHVNIYYEQLKRVTHNFTRDTTRINCAKLNSLHLNGRRLPKYAKDYFPHV